MAYFTIMAEFRGCYSDNDSAQTIRCNTRRELKQALESEAYYLRDAGAIGLSKRAIAAHAAWCWRDRKSASPYPRVLAFRYAHHSAGNNCMGLMVYNATRADLLNSETE